MRNSLMKLLISALFAIGLFSAVATADPSKGEKILTRVIHSGCPMPASRLAMAHSQKEWEEIYKAGKMAEEIKKMCPKLGEIKPLSKKYAQDVYEYLEHYSNDSGAIPA